MRTVKAILAFWIALVAAGCEYEVPLAEKQGLPVDNQVFGLWEKITKGGYPRPVDGMKISRRSGNEYLIRLYDKGGDTYFRGYEIKLAGLSCIQIQDISKKGSYETDRRLEKQKITAS